MSAEATWQVSADPLTPSLPVTVSTRSEQSRVFSRGVTARGLLRPFRRDRKTDLANGSGLELVASNVGQILGTICGSDFSEGELPWRTEFGSLLQLLRLRNNSPALAEQARAFVAGAVRRWEPRAAITSVRIERPGAPDQQNQLVIRVTWDLRGLGATADRVVIPGIETTVAVG